MGREHPDAMRALQFLVGGLVTFGGASLAAFSRSTPSGVELGLIHLKDMGWWPCYAILTLRGYAPRLPGFLVAINGTTN